MGVGGFKLLNPHRGASFLALFISVYTRILCSRCNVSFLRILIWKSITMATAEA